MWWWNLILHKGEMSKSWAKFQQKYWVKLIFIKEFYVWKAIEHERFKIATIKIKSGIEQLMFGEDLLSYHETIKWDSVLWMLFVLFSEKAKVIQMIKEGLRVIAKHHVVIAKERFLQSFL